MLIFISFCSKEPFRLFWAKLRCFQHYVSEKRLFLGFLRKLCFWPFILSKTCFGVLAMKSDVLSILLQTNSDLVFRFLMPFFDSHSSENTFLYVGNKNALLWVLYHKKSVFAFSLLKRCTQLYSTKNMFGLFAVILGCFQSYCTKKRSSSSMQRVTLIFTWFYSNNGFAFFWLSYAVSESSFWVQPCSLFPKPNYTLDAVYYRKNVLACWQLYQVTLRLKSVSAFLCLKYAVFSFIEGKTCFGLFAVKLGCFRRYCTGKCFLPVCS